MIDDPHADPIERARHALADPDTDAEALRVALAGLVAFFDEEMRRGRETAGDLARLLAQLGNGTQGGP